jgi:hypothetical protein
MALTPRFTLWLEMLARRDRSMVVLFLLAAVIVVFVYYARPWRRRWLLWAGVMAFWWTLAVFLLLKPPPIPHPTFGLLMGQPLWYDETFTVAVSRLPYEQMQAAIAGDVHPPLWYIIEWATIRLLGDSPLAVRVPAMLFGLASVFLTYRLAQALGYERQTALWAAGLLALMPAQIYYAQEARMYTLLEFCVLVAVLGLVERRAWLMGLGMLGALYTHNLGLFFVVVIGLLALWQERHRLREALWNADDGFLVIGMSVLVLWIPGLLLAFRQIQAVDHGFWLQASGLGGYLLPIYRLTLGMGVVNFFEQHAALAAGGLGALALWTALRDRERGIVPLALVLGPALLLVVLSTLWRPVYLERVFVAALPMLAILAASALRRMHPEHCAPILVVLVPVVFVCLLFQSKGTEGHAAFARQIVEQYEHGDVIYHANLASYIQLSYYLPEAEHVCWPDAGDLEQALTVETQEAMGVRRADAAEVEADRLLVVWVENPLTTAAEVQALEAALELGTAKQLLTWEESELVKAGVWEVRHEGNHQNGGFDD